MKLKKIVKFLKKNFFLPILLIIVIVVGLFFLFNKTSPKKSRVFVTVKISQGAWWANTQRPGAWYLNSFKKGDISKDLGGNTQAEIVRKRYYRFYGGDFYDIYITLRLRVGYNKKTSQYTFNRSPISVGSPVDIDFPTTRVTGTILNISSKIDTDKSIEKTIHLTKRNAFPWEFDAIKIGDGFFNGENKIFEILDKSSIDTTSLTSDPFGNSNSQLSETSKYISVKAKVLLKYVNNQYILGEDQLITPGRNISISTPNFVFEDYIVSKIE